MYPVPLFVLSFFIGFFQSQPVAPQDNDHAVLMEVVATTYDTHRAETLLYLRVFRNGIAEGHPTHEVDFRSLTTKKVPIPEGLMLKLEEFVNSPKTMRLADRYDRQWGNVDFGQSWQITISQGPHRKAIELANFQPFLARAKHKPYPTQLEKLGCIIWELRKDVLNEPPEKDYIRGCHALGY